MKHMGRDEWMSQIVDRYEGPLVRYALQVTGDLEAARDVVQDVFLRLWQADAERLEGRLAEWLFRVCRNRALDLRRKDCRLQPMNEPSWRETASPEPSPDKAAALKENAGEMLRFLAMLPPNQQEVIRLKFQNQLSYQEISRVIQLSETNVGFLIHTAIKTLRQKMKCARQTTT
jgi:RNA polymerase sigma factor (sigma-70 family)